MMNVCQDRGLCRCACGRYGAGFSTPPLGHHCQVGGRSSNCTAIMLLLNSNVTGRRLTRLAQLFLTPSSSSSCPKENPGVKLPPSHDIATQTPPLHVGIADSVQFFDAEHVVTTAAVATMVLPVKGIVKDITVDSSTEAVDTHVVSAMS